MALSNSEMVEKILDTLQAQPGGVVRINVDGQDVQVDREQLLKELTFWEGRAARESGRRPRVSSIHLGG